MTPEETAHQIAAGSAYGTLAIWAGLAAGITLLLGFFIPLPSTVLVPALFVVITAAVVLTLTSARAATLSP